VKKTSKKHSGNIVFHYDNIKCVSFNLPLFKILIIIIIIIIIISSAHPEAIWRYGSNTSSSLGQSAVH